MRGRTASLLLVLCLPPLLPATCNPKRTGPDPAADTQEPPGPPTPVKPEEASGCPPAEAAAPPLGPVVGPACPGTAPGADPAIAGEIDEKAGSLAGGLEPVGDAFGTSVGSEPSILKSAVLQGPPHCYVIVALCKDDAVPSVHLTAAGSDESVVEQGPAVRICPEVTGPFDVALSVEDGEHACAARIYGD